MVKFVRIGNILQGSLCGALFTASSHYLTNSMIFDTGQPRSALLLRKTIDKPIIHSSDMVLLKKNNEGNEKEEAKKEARSKNAEGRLKGKK